MAAVAIPIVDKILGLGEKTLGFGKQFTQEKTKRIIAKDGDAVQKEENASNEFLASMKSLEASYGAKNRTKMESLIGGFNSLIRPLITTMLMFGLMGSIVSETIANSFQNLKLIPMWYVDATVKIIFWWFGLRQADKTLNGIAQTIKQARPMKKEDAEEVKTLVRRKFEELKDRQNKIIEAKEKEVEILNSMIDENGDGLDDRGMDQIMEHEGVRLNVYRCTSNKLTIGVGRNLEDRGITKEEAMYLFANDVRDFKTRLYKEIPWIEKLTVARQWVLINMAFNMGIAGLMKWKNTLSLIEKGRYKLAASMMKKSKWAKQVKERRYKPLCKQMETGDFV